MSWTNELYHVYELVNNNNDENNDEQVPMAPVAHDIIKANIEIAIDEHGNFKNAAILPDDEEIIIQVSEESAARSGTMSKPHPLNDKLKYFIKDNGIFYDLYMNNLKKWKDSDYTHPAVAAIYQYLEQSDILYDLKEAGIIVDEKKEKDKDKNGDKIVRFYIMYDDLQLESRTWEDASLREAYQKYNATTFEDVQLCYATGELLPCTYNHPKVVGNAKIISSNDDKGCTFRGRFYDKKQALSVSYDFSQKIHNALKWLIKKQGKRYGGLNIVIWASAEDAICKVPDDFLEHNPEDDFLDEECYDTLPLYRDWLKKYLFGYRQELQNNSKLMIIGLANATNGRMSISLYEELSASDFLNNLEYWHISSSWLRYDKVKKVNTIKSCSLYEIIHSAYGSEEKGILVCEPKALQRNILRLLPCIMMKRHLPMDLIQALYQKASNPLAYNKQYNHQCVIEVACSMLRLKMNEKKEDVEFMYYDKDEKDRSYLYGCLLAIADKAEKDTYDEEEKKKRITNARRYWEIFSQKPYQTWKIIEERLQPYLNRHPYRGLVEKNIEEVTDKFTKESFADNTRLEPLYLLGYHHFTSFMYRNGKTEEDK
ncbi:type I-C CRISPR-associated protein Cas8c/Csd1 [Selenomonas ruminantium]|uniref:type I-C CRISPR-associated protein Cas8c/Csd1 n=1 Tax=Selenomonas ruminantium TaxID=971 RepID=UPI0026EA7A0C|nr:type I-C CRISPR-associated protein Cas8c/Csd1 [Selenomonas ruminantium]